MGLVSRAKAIITSPRQEWPVIDGEAATTGAIYAGYVFPLAAVGPAASLIGLTVFGIGGFRFSLGTALRGSIVRYLAAVAGTWVLALVIDVLAPTFGGEKNPVQALKAAAYSSTAAWVAGIFSLVPALSFLGLLGLYSLYLLWLGLPILMKAPPEKATGYAAAVVVIALAIHVVLGAIAARLAWGGAGPPGM